MIIIGPQRDKTCLLGFHYISIFLYKMAIADKVSNVIAMHNVLENKNNSEMISIGCNAIYCNSELVFSMIKLKPMYKQYVNLML